MRRFRYKKDEAYVWESDEIRVEFSNICITANKKKEIKQDDIEDMIRIWNEVVEEFLKGI